MPKPGGLKGRCDTQRGTAPQRDWGGSLSQVRARMSDLLAMLRSIAICNAEPRTHDQPRNMRVGRRLAPTVPTITKVCSAEVKSLELPNNAAMSHIF